ncbi:MFS transporter [Dactylosporangium sp. NPDC005572]|uniref:MFS transporter n=1 Tax=Dactylosporangium sp. NPDC005572 TaxID=3156889 RepID=UPI0033A4F833
MSMRRLMDNRDVRLYLGGQVCSLLGDSALWLAMGVWVKSLTGSSAAAGLVFFFFTAPTLLAPVAGLLVDRVRKRPLLVVANLVSAAVVLLLLLVDGAEDVWIVYLVMSLHGLAYAVLGAAQSALLIQIVPTEQLADANGFLRTAQETLRLVGPLAGSGLFVLLGGHFVAVLDAVTFAVPVMCLLKLRLREPRPKPWQHHWSAEMLAGVRFVGRTAPLRHVVTATATALLVFGFTETTVFAVVGQGLHRQPAFVGVLVAVQGAGALLGGPTAAPLVRRLGERRVIGLGLATAAVGALLQTPPSLPFVLGGVGLFGVSLPWIVVGFTTLLQRVTPADLQGRVYAAASTMITVPQTISIAVGAGLVTALGYRILLATAAVVTALASGYLLRPSADRERVDRGAHAADEG